MSGDGKRGETAINPLMRPERKLKTFIQGMYLTHPPPPSQGEGGKDA